MCDSKYKLNGLSGNALKIIAAFSMLVDHIGYLFFSETELLRIIGRIAFPVLRLWFQKAADIPEINCGIFW